MDNETTPFHVLYWQSEKITELMGAMNQAQLVMSPVKKDKENPFFGSHYADLPAVWEALLPFREAGIVILQLPMEGRVGHLTLDTQFIHAPSGQWIRSRLVMPLPKQDPQGMGSAISYSRRYMLGCMSGLVTAEDDDANKTNQPPGKTFAEKFPAVQPIPAPIVPPGGSQAPSERVAWTVPQTEWNVKAKTAGLRASELDDEPLAKFLKYYQGKIDKDPNSKWRQEWEEAIFDIEEEIALRRDGLVLR